MIGHTEVSTEAELPRIKDEFVHRRAALVPRPRLHLIKFQVDHQRRP